MLRPPTWVRRIVLGLVLGAVFMFLLVVFDVLPGDPLTYMALISVGLFFDNVFDRSERPDR